MQRGGRSSPCCLQAVTVWTRDQSAPATADHYPRITQNITHSRSPGASSQRFTDSNPIPDSRLRCPQRSFLPKTLLFLARLKLCAPRSLRPTSYRREQRCACALLPCGHWRARVQRVNGVQRGAGGGDGGRYQSDILINSLDQMTSSLIYLSHREEHNNMFVHHSSRFLNNNPHFIKSKVIKGLKNSKIHHR